MVINNGFTNNISRNVERIGNNGSAARPQMPVQSAGAFDTILKEKLSRQEGVKFSKHAELRLASRNIKLSQDQMAKVNDAVKKAEAKGVKDALVLTDNAALVVNVKSKTVVTAMDRSELKDNVFTNIDGAVIT